MKFVISKSRLLLYIAIFMLALFSFTPGLTSTIYILNGKGAYITLLISILIMYYVNGNYISSKITYTNAIVILMLLVVVLNNNKNIQNGSYLQLIFMLVFWIFFILASKFNNWQEIAMKVLLVFAFFFLLMTFYELINPDFFINKVMPLFKEYSSEYKQKADWGLGYYAGFSANPAINVCILTMGMGVCIAKAIESNFHSKGKWMLFSGLFFVGIFLTGKRGPAVFTIIALLVTFIMSYKGNSINKYLKILVISIIAVLCFYVISLYYPEVLSVLRRFQTKAASGDSSNGRIELWTLSLNFFLKNPIFGNGWDSLKYSINMNSHNVYIQLLAECGLIGFVVYVSFFVISLIHVGVAMKTYKNDKIHYAYIIFSCFYQIYFLLYCLTGNALYDSPTLFLYVIAAAIGEYYFMKYRTEHICVE